MNHKALTFLIITALVSHNVSAMQSMAAGARFLCNHKTVVVGALGGAAVAYAWWKGYNPLSWWRTSFQTTAPSLAIATALKTTGVPVSTVGNAPLSVVAPNVSATSNQKVSAVTTTVSSNSAVQEQPSNQQQSQQPKRKNAEVGVLCAALHARCGAQSFARFLMQPLCREIATWIPQENQFHVFSRGILGSIKGMCNCPVTIHVEIEDEQNTNLIASCKLSTEKAPLTIMPIRPVIMRIVGYEYVAQAKGSFKDETYVEYRLAPEQAASLSCISVDLGQSYTNVEFYDKMNNRMTVEKVS